MRLAACSGVAVPQEEWAVPLVAQSEVRRAGAAAVLPAQGLAAETRVESAPEAPAEPRLLGAFRGTAHRAIETRQVAVGLVEQDPVVVA